jgi:adenosylcobinamide-phosphate synthase
MPAIALLFAWGLDVFVGEPPAALHPVVWMGRAIRPLARMQARAPGRDFVLGSLYTLLVLALITLAGWSSMRGLARWPWLSLAVQTYLLWSCFALKALLDATRVVGDALARADLADGRAGLGSLCSRAASELSATELAGAAIESVSENASDSVVAPLFYYVLGGVPLVLLYRTANTFDAMVGYRGRFEYLGKTAARVDDVLNLVPARLTALCLLLAGAVQGLPVVRALGVWWRDARRTESPNAGHPMAMAAGLLGVRLDKRDHYVLGAQLSPPDAAAIASSLKLVRGACWLAALFCFMLLGLGGAWCATGRH